MTTRRMLADWYALLKRDFWALILGGALVSLVGGFSLGLLSLPTAAGLRLALLRRVREGRTIQVGDVFAIVSPFGRWLKAWLALVGLAMLLAVAIVVIFIVAVFNLGSSAGGGSGFDRHNVVVTVAVVALASVLVGLILGTLLLYTTTIMADDREANLFAAIGRSCRMITRGGILKRGWLVILSMLVAFGVRLLIVAPLALVSLTFAWRWSSYVGLAFAGLSVPLQVAMYLVDIGEGGRLPSAGASVDTKAPV